MAPVHPSGVVTLLFTDIEGSTLRWERDREAMALAVRRHDEVLREIIESSGGYVFKTLGDAFCAAFARPQDAARAALQAQRAICDADFSAVGGLPVRMALHAGQCDERDGDYFGPTVNRVARLLAIANGGQIVVSASAAHLLRDLLPAGCALADAGEHRLKDLSAPETVALLHADGVAASAAPLRSLSTMKNNLPSFLVPIIGRVEEIEQIEQWLNESRLASVIGPGGIGKTRVAVQVAAQRLALEPGGAWFVDLAPLSSAAMVVPAFAAAIGAETIAGRDADADLLAVLRKLQATVVLDNCEHVIAEVARVVELVMQNCPGVRVLATSREPLGVPGERVFRLDTLDEKSALELFVTRARHADRRFGPPREGEQRAVILQLCRRLDCIALAIELAAARINVLSPAELVEHLGERLDLLSAGSRTALPRQQTLRALIDWSYDLLLEQERRVFRVLCVFAGGATMEAASRVVAESSGLEPRRVLSLVAALVEKSMLVVQPGAGGARRFGMLESVREYARERLANAGESDRAARAHAAYYATLAERAEAQWGELPESAWLAQYAVDFDNVRAAAEWALAHDPELASGMACDMRALWFYAGTVASGRDYTMAVLRALGEERAESPQALPAWIALAALARWTREFDLGVDAGERALAIADRIGNKLLAARARQLTGWSRFQLGVDSARAMRELEQAAAELQILQPRSLHAVLALGDYAMPLAAVDRAKGRLLLLEAMLRARAYDWPAATLRLEINLAEMEFVTGHTDAAIEQVRRAMAIAHGTGATLALLVISLNHASYLTYAGRIDEGLAAASEALTFARERGNAPGAAIALQTLALAEAARGDAHLAARLLGFVDSFYEGHGAERERSEEIVRERIVERLGERLSEDELREDVALGRTLDFDAACALATVESAASKS